MVKTPVCWLGLLPLIFAVLIPSCASGPLAGTAATTIIIAPFNVVSSLPPELEGSTKMVSAVLVEYLEAHGKTVAVMGFRAGRDLWKASIQEVRNSDDKRNFENAARVYARKIGEQFEFDALIVPSLFIQNAKMSSRTVKWDGAEQTMEQRGTLGTKYQGLRTSSNVRAASLFIHVLDREGGSVQTSRRGLELIQHIEFGTKKRGGYSGTKDPQMNLVDDVPPIQDKDRVRAGIASALFPFLPEEIPTSPTTSPEAS